MAAWRESEAIRKDKPRQWILKDAVLLEIAGSLRGRHEALRDLLGRNGTLLELLGDIQFDLRLLVPGDPAVRARTRQLLDATLLQAQTLNILAGGRFERLYDVHQRLESRQ